MRQEDYRTTVRKHSPNLYSQLIDAEIRGAAIDWQGFAAMAVRGAKERRIGFRVVKFIKNLWRRITYGKRSEKKEDKAKSSAKTKTDDG